MGEPSTCATMTYRLIGFDDGNSSEAEFAKPSVASAPLESDLPIERFLIEIRSGHD